jgi:K(+)-stimulated pyrophosphate-energized sodium pump
MQLGAQAFLIFIFLVLSAGAALLYSRRTTLWCLKQERGSAEMQAIGDSIFEGAMAFLKRQYQILSVFVLVVSGILIWINAGPLRWIGVSFAFGAFCSALSGFIGMRVATQCNTRTAAAACTGLNLALKIAFRGGAVMGISVVGIAILGFCLLLGFLCLWYGTEIATLQHIVMPIIAGYALGASSIALFARVGGGIFTKAADVGADLVGKVEMGIPEDSPNNPATIADNVGDNVGDVAGMGADLFESYFDAILGAMVIGVFMAGTDVLGQLQLMLLPLVISAIGIWVSVGSTFLVYVREDGNPQKAMNLGTMTATGVTALLTLPACLFLGPASFEGHYSNLGIFWATITGLIAGILIGKIAEYYTGMHMKPTRTIAKSCETGPATAIISGLAVGMRSTVLPILCFVVATLLAYKFAGLYGIAIAAVGMLSTTGIQLAVDAYGPIADNAGGIAEMSGLGHEVRSRTDKLDAVGNTTAAIGKGFAIGSAALTALALFSAFRNSVGLESIDVTKPLTICGLFLGGVTPFLFAALSLEAVSKAAFSMIEEVRRQFRTIPGLLQGKAKPDYAKCVDISTRAALREMILPGLLSILTPIVAVWIGGTELLGGVLVGVTLSGVLLALFMANAGGAWDNAKKMIEGGLHGGKGGAPHAAAVIGDTVGDPLKDTAGPSISILIKVMCVLSLTLAPIFKEWTPLLENWLK